jgi:ribosomal-protein-alanine N-acetyltransferase
MEKGLYQPASAIRTSTAAAGATVETNWRHLVPVLTSATITLRELEPGDAPSLLAMLTTEEVTRFISPPPTTIEGFERFIAWTREQRAAGQYICFAVVPAGMTTAVGLFQVRSLASDFSTAEWGFALGSGFWGTGLFMEGARQVIDFAFGSIGVHRLEARASVENGRGNGALRKLGAVQEGVLRRAFLRDGRYHDQVLWSLIDSDWVAAAQGRETHPTIH